MTVFINLKHLSTGRYICAVGVELNAKTVTPHWVTHWNVVIPIMQPGFEASSSSHLAGHLRDVGAAECNNYHFLVDLRTRARLCGRAQLKTAYTRSIIRRTRDFPTQSAGSYYYNVIIIILIHIRERRVPVRFFDYPIRRRSYDKRVKSNTRKNKMDWNMRL